MIEWHYTLNMGEGHKKTVAKGLNSRFFLMHPALLLLYYIGVQFSLPLCIQIQFLFTTVFYIYAAYGTLLL